MLLHTVLAVVCGGLLVSARRSVDWFGDTTEDDGSPGAQQIMNNADGRPQSPWSDMHVPQDWVDSAVDSDIPQEGPRVDDGTQLQNEDGGKTIYQLLQDDPWHYSRIFKLVNASEEVTRLLNDSTLNITFFATPNWAFPKEEPPPPPKSGRWQDIFREGDNFGDILSAAEGLLNGDRKPHDDVLLKVLKYILLYETLPSRLTVSDLAKNTTFPTSLTLPDGSLDSQPLRVRTGGRFGSLRLNLYADVVKADIPAVNGLVHVTSHSVLPPPSAFQIVFLFPDAFSTLSSAIQRTGLTDEVDWRDSRKDHTVVGSPAVTFFAPTNKAFSRLPHNLRTFLFSPFGERALKKILQFHIVPEFVLHTDFIHNASESESEPTSYDADLSQVYNHMTFDAYDEDFDLEQPEDDPLYSSEWDTEAFYGQQEFYGHHFPFPPFHHQPPMPHCEPHWPWFPHHEQHFPYHYPPAHYLPIVHHGGGWRHPPPSPYTCHDKSRCPSFPPEFEDFSHGAFFPPPFADCAPPPPPPPFFGHEPQHHPQNDHDHHPRSFPAHEPHSPPFPIHGPPHPPPFPGQDDHPPRRPPSPPPPPPPPPGSPPKKRPSPFSLVFSRNTTAPTLLGDCTLNVHVAQYAFRLPLPGHHATHYTTRMSANGAPVVLPDVPTRNGALHVVNRLLNPKPRGSPRGPREHEREGSYYEPDGGWSGAQEDVEDWSDEWMGWEEWLPAWAAED